MLDQLVESTSHTEENRRKSGLLLTTFVILTTVLLSSWVYSLFAKDYGMGDGELSLQTLVAPPVVEEPPKPEPEEEKPKEQQKQAVDVRTELIQNMNMSPVRPPETISTKPNTVPPIRDVPTAIGKSNINSAAPPTGGFRQERDPGDGTGSGGSGGGESENRGGGAPPPPPPPPPVPKKPISGGVLNGKARSLPKPPYPPAARAVRASGAVSVQVVIDESGNVISASAVSGHPLLRQAAAQAARGAKFSPTMLSGQPVKVQGVITYNFVAP